MKSVVVLEAQRRQRATRSFSSGGLAGQWEDMRCLGSGRCVTFAPSKFLGSVQGCVDSLSLASTLYIRSSVSASVDLTFKPQLHRTRLQECI